MAQTTYRALVAKVETLIKAIVPTDLKDQKFRAWETKASDIKDAGGRHHFRSFQIRNMGGRPGNFTDGVDIQWLETIRVTIAYPTTGNLDELDKIIREDTRKIRNKLFKDPGTNLDGWQDCELESHSEPDKREGVWFKDLDFAVQFIEDAT